MVQFETGFPLVRPWDIGRFRFVRKLQNASRNQGSVDEYTDLKRGNFQCAVKTMPKRWLTAGPQEFARKYKDEKERPWTDIAIVAYLNSRSCPFACELLGVFVDQTISYVVFSLASGGDLMAWTVACTLRGTARETAAQPLVMQIFEAVKEIHELGIAHRDISLENILLHEKEPGRTPQVKIIDFGMASVSRRCAAGKVYGKDPYQAPEMHTSKAGYDSFLTDIFALGVTTFMVIFERNPWASTATNGCRHFDAAAKMGIRAWLAMRSRPEKMPKPVAVTNAIGEGCQDLLASALTFDPERRATLGEACWAGSRYSLWTSRWLLKVPDECSSVATTCDTDSYSQH